MLKVQGPLVLGEAGVPVSATPQSHIRNLFGCPLYFLVLSVSYIKERQDLQCLLQLRFLLGSLG